MTKKLYLIAPGKEELLEGSPVSLLFLGEWIRRHSNYDVEIARSLDQIPLEKDVYVGISVTTPTYQKGLEIARELKRRSQDIKVILGGPHTKGQGKIIKRHKEVDYVVEGEGEKALVKILDGTKESIVYGDPLSSGELDSVSVSDLITLDSEYFTTLRQFGRMNYISTRGCPYHCSFCASNGIVTKKSARKVIEDLEILTKKGFIKVSMQDNYFGYDYSRIEKICREILARGIKIDWDCQTRVESMQDEGLLRLMKSAGCSAVYIGIENFHPATLSRMDKTKYSAEYTRMSKEAIIKLVGVGIKPLIDLQVGLPYENQEVREENLRALGDIGKVVQTYCSEVEIFLQLSVVYPGTIDFHRLLEEGVSEDIFESFTEWEEENGEEIKRLLEENHLIHGTGGIPLGILDYERLKKGEFIIDQTRIQAIKDYICKIRKLGGIRVYSD